MAISWENVWQLRAEIYELFAELLLEVPGRDLITKSNAGFWEQFPLEAANETMKQGIQDIINWSHEIDKPHTEEAVTNLRVDFAQLFIGPDKLKAPPWESVYKTPQKLLFGAPAFEVRDWYLDWGKELSRKGKEPEDHLGYELYFLSCLSRRTAEAQNEIKELVNAQLRFLEQHPLTWLDDFAKDVIANSTSGFYAGLVKLIKGFLLWDRELLQEWQH